MRLKMTELIVVEKIAEWQRLKALVLDSVSSPITRRVYNMALDEFLAWLKQEPWPGFSKATVSAWRVSLEARGLGSSSHPCRRRQPDLRRHRGSMESVASFGNRRLPCRDKAQAVQQAYAEALAQPNAHGQERSVLVVCATHEEIGIVTAAIRKERIEAGTLGQSVLLERKCATELDHGPDFRRS